jgi:phosphate transport system substrate-binding protein
LRDFHVLRRREEQVKFKQWMAVAVVAALATGAVALTGCSGGASTPASTGSTSSTASSNLQGTINVSGSDTMVNLAQAWAEKFNGENPGVVITVKGGGSGNGIAALINKTVQFADSSREIKPEEISQATSNGVNPVKTEVARDGVVIAVNTANTVTGLTKEQLGKIYAGEITDWKDVGGTPGPIVLLGRDSSSGTYSFINDEVLAKLPNKPPYAKSMRNLQSTQAIVDEVSKNAAAIGYIGLGYENASIKALPIDGSTASEATVLDGTYALSRGLNMYSNGEPAGVEKAYIDWILGAEGQALVKEQGFVPLKK